MQIFLSLLATSYPPVWVLLSGLAGIVLIPIGGLNLLLALLTVFLRPQADGTRRLSCRWMFWLPGASLLLLVLGVSGEQWDRHQSAFPAAEELKLLAIPVALLMAAAIVAIIDNRRP